AVAGQDAAADDDAAAVHLAVERERAEVDDELIGETRVRRGQRQRAAAGLDQTEIDRRIRVAANRRVAEDGAGEGRRGAAGADDQLPLADQDGAVAGDRAYRVLVIVQRERAWRIHDDGGGIVDDAVEALGQRAVGDRRRGADVAGHGQRLWALLD